MTAEVAVMNKSAVALAADSAATSSQKIYNSVNKLFSLSENHPVGVMIYGNSDLMGVPWETLIKVYRESLGNRSEPHLKTYAETFIEWIVNEHLLFPDDERLNYVRRMVFTYLDSIRQILLPHRTSKSADLKKLIHDTVQNQFFTPLCTSYDEIPSLPTDFRVRLRTQYEDVIEDLAKTVLGEFSPDAKAKELIRDHCIECLCRIFFCDFSGIVIAGFGEKELFPSLVEFKIEGMPLDNVLKFHQQRHTQIGFKNTASIDAFAQREMVDTFMTGVHPEVTKNLQHFLQNVLHKYEQQISSSFSGARKAALKAQIAQANHVILTELNQELEKHKREYHVSPVLDAVGLLPKDELAAMAESLVNLTVLKRRISTDQETVGGPIDVAVISKGDGFIWIKRKHYFTKELNPRYVSRINFSSQKGTQHQ